MQDFTVLPMFHTLNSGIHVLVFKVTEVVPRSLTLQEHDFADSLPAKLHRGVPTVGMFLSDTLFG